jgi:hypothetical protein
VKKLVTLALVAVGFTTAISTEIAKFVVAL